MGRRKPEFRIANSERNPKAAYAEDVVAHVEAPNEKCPLVTPGVTKCIYIQRGTRR